MEKVPKMDEAAPVLQPNGRTAFAAADTACVDLQNGRIKRSIVYESGVVSGFGFYLCGTRWIAEATRDRKRLKD